MAVSGSRRRSGERDRLPPVLARPHPPPRAIRATLSRPLPRRHELVPGGISRRVPGDHVALVRAEGDVTILGFVILVAVVLYLALAFLSWWARQ